MIPEGAAGALAELERRKFTAEEGVSILVLHYTHLTHLTSSGPSYSIEWYI